MHQTIIESINQKTTLNLTYDGIVREVEPHAYGVGTSGNDLLRCYQIAGGHKSEKPHSWELLKIEKISGLSIGSPFSGPRPEYKRGDKAMSTIYAEL